MKEKILKWLLIILGTISWSITMVKSALIYPYGMGFWGPNGHDGIWHIALSESLAKGNLTLPIFAGEYLKNYHIGFDLILGYLSKVTTIPVVNLYFQVLPVLFSILIGILSYNFIFLWTKSKTSALWSTFFVYFGGSFAWIIGKGESTFWSQQSISTLINPPFALSLVLLLLGLTSLLKNKRFLAILFFGILISIKSYAGVLTLGSLLVCSFFDYIKNRKKDILWVFLGSLALSIILYLPLNKNSSSLLVWQPFWFLETMMGLTDRLGWERFYSAMTNYKLADNFIKGIPAYLLAFIIFWIGNMGTRIVKEILVIKWIMNIKKITYVEVFLTAIIMAGGIIPLFFLQKGTPWNTIQFFYYSLFFSGLLAGVAMEKLSKPLTILIVLLTIPTTLLTLRDVYIPSRPPAKLSMKELESLRFLSEKTDGVVLTYPFDSDKAKVAENNPPRPLYLYESTAYVSAFSKKQVFLEDQVNLDITDHDWRKRREMIIQWYKEDDQEIARKFLKDNEIKYVYWVGGQRAVLGETQLGLNLVYENSESKVYEVIIPE